MAVSLIKKEEAHILRVLPMLLKKDVRFRQEVSIVLSEVFASKGELERILEEMQKNREESAKKFDLQIRESQAFREETVKRFEESDRRFELQIKELQALKKEATERFETMDKRLSLQISDLEIEMDRRFDAIKERLEVIVVAIDRQFEAMQQQMDKRFEAMQQQMDKRFEAMQQQMDKRFEDMDKRFEAMNKQIEARFEAMNERFEDQKDWVGKVVGGLQGRAGRNLEDVIAGTLRVALNRRDIKPESIIMRKKFLDDEGKIGPAGRSYEIDIYAHNSESMIFEIKSYAEPEDVLRFNDKAELVKEKLSLPNPAKILITLQKGREMVDACRNLGVELV